MNLKKSKLFVALILWLVANIIIAQNQIGCISGNCNTGKGTFQFKDGSIYVGEFVNNHMEGFGKLTDSRGNVYTGYFKNDKYDGIGKFERTDGTKYIGEFKEGKRNGLGTQWYSATYKEKGKWENDRFIEEANFEDFKIVEPYSFCNTLQELLNAAGNNFESVKGDKVSAYIQDEFYCTLPIKELTTVSIQTEKGYSGTYFKGTKAEAQQKFEELNKIIKDCLNEGCFRAQLQLNNGINDKFYEYTLLSATSICNSNSIGTKIIVRLSILQNSGNVTLEITPKKE